MSRAPLGLLAVFAASACEATPPARPAVAGNAPPALHVEGNALVANGKRVRLFGVNHSGSEYACIAGAGVFEGPADSTLTTAMTSWRINAVRVPLNEHCWL